MHRTLHHVGYHARIEDMSQATLHMEMWLECRIRFCIGGFYDVASRLRLSKNVIFADFHDFCTVHGLAVDATGTAATRVGLHTRTMCGCVLCVRVCSLCAHEWCVWCVRVCVRCVPDVSSVYRTQVCVYGSCMCACVCVCVCNVCLVCLSRRFPGYHSH